MKIAQRRVLAQQKATCRENSTRTKGPYLYKNCSILMQVLLRYAATVQNVSCYWPAPFLQLCARKSVFPPLGIQLLENDTEDVFDPGIFQVAGQAHASRNNRCNVWKCSLLKNVDSRLSARKIAILFSEDNSPIFPHPETSASERILELALLEYSSYFFHVFNGSSFTKSPIQITSSQPVDL